MVIVVMDFSIKKILESPIRKKVVAVEYIREGLMSRVFSLEDFSDQCNTRRINVRTILIVQAFPASPGTANSDISCDFA